MITIKNLLSKTTAIIFPGGTIILQRSVQNKETHLRGISDITKVEPNFPFCLDSLFEDYLSYDPYLCSLWSNKGRKKLNTYISSLLSCSLLWDLQPRKSRTISPDFFQIKWKIAGVFFVFHCGWLLFQRTTFMSECVHVELMDRETWFSYRSSRTHYCISTHRLFSNLQALKVKHAYVVEAFSCECGTSLHWRQTWKSAFFFSRVFFFFLLPCLFWLLLKVLCS